MESILKEMPEWARIVGVFIIILFGVGGFSSIITNFLSRKKTESEATLNEAEAIQKISIADKSNTEVAKDLIAEYKTMLNEERGERKKLESKVDKLETIILDLKRASEKELISLRTELNSTKSKLTISQREISILKNHLKLVEDRWNSLTTEPFPITTIRTYGKDIITGENND